MPSPMHATAEQSEEASADAVDRWESEARAAPGAVEETDRISSALKLADLHAMGKEGVTQSYRLSDEYLRIGIEACERIASQSPEFVRDRLPRAQCNRADILSIGRGGVERDEVEAFSLFWKAHKGGHIPGTYSVAYYLQLKRIKEQLASDPKYRAVAEGVAETSAASLFEDAAAGFAELAKKEPVPYHLFCSAFLTLHSDHGDETAIRQAVRLLQQASESDSGAATVARSLNYLGSLYFCGTAGCSEHAAFAAFNESARRQYSLGESNLAFCYQHGIGVEPDESLATKLIRKAEERGYDQEWSDWSFNWFPAIGEIQIVQGWNLRRVAEGRRCFRRAVLENKHEPAGECLTVEVKHVHVGELTDELFDELHDAFLDALGRKRGSPRWRPNFSLVTRWLSGPKAKAKLALWCRIRHAQLMTRMKEDREQSNQGSKWQQAIPQLEEAQFPNLTAKEFSGHIDELEAAATAIRSQACDDLARVGNAKKTADVGNEISRLRALAFGLDDAVGIDTAAEIMGLSKVRVRQLAADGRIGKRVDGRFVFSRTELSAFAGLERPTGIHRSG